MIDSVVINLLMSNFYTEEDLPLRKVRVFTLSRDIMITSPRIVQKSTPQRSPLWAVTKLVLGEF